MTVATMGPAIEAGIPGVESGISDLWAKLRRAERRIATERLLLGVTIGVAVGIAAFGASEILAALSDGAGLEERQRAIAIAIGVGTAVLASAILLIRRPRANDLARTADNAFSLNERVSTAIEVASKPARASTVLGRALLLDTGQRATVVDPVALSAFRWTRIVLPPLAAIAFAAVAIVATPDDASDSTAATPAPALTQAETTQAADDLARIANLFEADAAERDDPFLQAIAREIGEVQQQVELGEVTDRTELLDELDRLADFAAAAYEEAGEAPGTPEDLTQLLETMRQQIADGPAAAPDQPAAPETPNQPGAPTQDGAGPPPDLGDLLAEMEAAPEQDALPTLTPQAGEPAAVPGDIYEAARAAAAAAQQEQNAQLNAGAEMVGPGADAGQGEGLLAGDGERPLISDEIEIGDEPFELAGEMLLEDELDGDGRRITIDIPPEAMALQLDPGEVVAGEWTRLPEREVGRPPLPIGAQDFVARYFRSIIEEVE